MNLQQLEYFKTIAETENFTIASQKLAVSQPALSKAIAKLEEELEVPLFKKEGRNIKLTSFGKIFLNHTSIALEEIEKGIKELKKITNSDSGTISISSTSNVGTYFMPLVISGFLNNNPNAKFQFNYQSTADMLMDLKNSNIELCFFDSVDNISQNGDIDFTPIKKEEYVLIVPKNHKLANEEEVSLKDLKDEYFVSSCEINEDKMQWYKNSLGYIPKISIKPSSSTIIEGLVATGAGISIIPNTPLINKNLVSVIKIKEEIKNRVIYMGWMKNSYISPICKSFKEFVISTDYGK